MNSTIALPSSWLMSRRTLRGPALSASRNRLTALPAMRAGAGTALGDRGAAQLPRRLEPTMPTTRTHLSWIREDSSMACPVTRSVPPRPNSPRTGKGAVTVTSTILRSPEGTRETVTVST